MTELLLELRASGHREAVVVSTCSRTEIYALAGPDGRDDLLRTFISNGTARMPGFKYTYNPEQIAAIAAYIKTLRPGNQDIPTARTQARAPTPAQ